MPLKGESKYSAYREEIVAAILHEKSDTAIARKIIVEHGGKLDAVRQYIVALRAEQRHPALATECDVLGLPLEDVKHYWHKGKQFSIFVKGKQATYADLKEEIIRDMRAHAPLYQNLYYSKTTEGHLLVIDPADIHLNKLCSAFETGDECNHDLIFQRVKDGIRGILNKVQGYEIDKILFVAGNDILHVDNPKNQTTAGTHQDTSLMWFDAFRLARKLMVECLELLLPVAPVVFHYNPSNHDYTNGFFLAQTIEAWFRNCDNITFDCGMAHRKYFAYGENLIGTTHGDGAKTADLPLLMAHEAPSQWAACKHRYIYTHHIHHKQSKDYMSVCVESLRSPSGADSWHHRNGYQHAPKAVEGFLHNKNHGQVARITHLF